MCVSCMSGPVCDFESQNFLHITCVTVGTYKGLIIKIVNKKDAVSDFHNIRTLNMTGILKMLSAISDKYSEGRASQDASHSELD